MREFIEELRDNWRNSYWWADHQGLRAFLIGVMLGVLGLVFSRLEGKKVTQVEIVERKK